MKIIPQKIHSKFEQTNKKLNSELLFYEIKLTEIEQNVILMKLINVQRIYLHTGGEKMTDTERLADIIKCSGYKYGFLAASLGITYQAFRNKMTNKSEFVPSEIEKLCNLLSIRTLKDKNDIFFASPVE